MSTPTIYGTSRDPWPYDYVVAALQFFALNPQALVSYLPPSFPKTTFHGNGDFDTSSPLIALVEIYAECIHAGINWNEWIDDPQAEDKEIESMFEALYQCIENVPIINDEEDLQCRHALLADDETEWALAISSCRDLAVKILKRIGLYEPDLAPLFSAKSILNEWSYGAYSENSSEQKDDPHPSRL